MPVGLRWYAAAVVFLALNMALPYWIIFSSWAFVFLIGIGGHRLAWRGSAVKTSFLLAVVFAITLTVVELVWAAVRDGRLSEEPAAVEGLWLVPVLALAGTMACMGEACGLAPSSRHAEVQAARVLGWGVCASLLLGILLLAPWQDEPLFGLFPDTPGVVSTALSAVCALSLVVLLWRLGGAEAEAEAVLPRLPGPV